MMATMEQQAIYERGFAAGMQDAGAIVIAALIYDGRTSIKVNDLKQYFAEVARPKRPLPQHILDILEEIEKERQQTVGD